MVLGGGKSSTRTKLFEQPLDKLFSSKAIKQLNNAIISCNTTKTPLCSSLSAPLSSTTLTWAKLSQENSAAKRKRTASRLRRFTIDANNNAHILSCITMSKLNNVISLNHHHSSQQHFTDQQNKSNHELSVSSSAKEQTKLINNKRSQEEAENERRQLYLNALPDPIRRLLHELCVRGPETVGIFRKSPNAKHCKELRQKLESDSQSLIEQFQVNVIASVFKEWLRSLPDCLLMSRLYPQWIDVAKLIEPVHLHNQQQQQQQQLLLSQHHSSSSYPDDDDHDIITTPFSVMSCNISGMRSTTPTTNSTTNISPSLIGDNVCKQRISSSDNDDHPGPLARALSCSIMTSDSGHSSGTTSQSSSPDSNVTGDIVGRDPFDSFATDSNDVTLITNSSRGTSGFDTDSMRHNHLTHQTSEPTNGTNRGQESTIMSTFAIRERHSECIRIVRQLLEALNEVNLILLRAIICVLWHIANNSEHNKMSSTNLGVCIGQSMLNNGYHSRQVSQSSSTFRFPTSTFTRRHRRERSQCLLSSTLSLSSLSPLSQPLVHSGSGYLESSSAQEAAKYVPILIAFMIENAQALFGSEVINLFGPEKVQRHKVDDDSPDSANSDIDMGENLCKDSKLPRLQKARSIDCSLPKLHNVDIVDSGTTVSTASPNDNSTFQNAQSNCQPSTSNISRSSNGPTQNFSSCSTTSSPVTDAKTDTILVQTSNVVGTSARQTKPPSPGQYRNNIPTPVAQEQTASTNRCTPSSCNQQQQQQQQQHSGASNSRMSKISFHYTTSCYGGEAVLYYPTAFASIKQQQQQQQQMQQPQQQQHARCPLWQNHQVRHQSSGAECHRSLSLNQPTNNGQNQNQPQRSHVMMLRDYYLSLQQQNQQQHHLMSNAYRLQRRQSQQILPQQQQQQQQYQRTSLGNHFLYQPLTQQHQTAHTSSVYHTGGHNNLSNNNTHMPMEQQPVSMHHQQQQQRPQQTQANYHPFANATSTMQPGDSIFVPPASIHCHHQSATALGTYQRAAQTRLAKIRPNPFTTTLYVKPSPIEPPTSQQISSSLNTSDSNKTNLMVHSVCTINHSSGKNSGVTVASGNNEQTSSGNSISASKQASEHHVIVASSSPVSGAEASVVVQHHQQASSLNCSSSSEHSADELSDEYAGSDWMETTMV